MDALYQHIDERLRTRKSCVVFENELQRVWPTEKRERSKRAAAIEAFARAHGLAATIHDPEFVSRFAGFPQDHHKAGAVPDPINVKVPGVGAGSDDAQ